VADKEVEWLVWAVPMHPRVDELTTLMVNVMKIEKGKMVAVPMHPRVDELTTLMVNVMKIEKCKKVAVPMHQTVPQKMTRLQR